MSSQLETVRSSGNDYLFSVTSSSFVCRGIPEFSTGMASPSLRRYWRTLSHLRLSQLYYLLRHRVLEANDLSRWPEAEVGILPWDGLPRVREWQPEVARKVIEAGGIQFLHEVPGDRESTSWADQETSRRQIYHANYCDFLNADFTSTRDSKLLHSANLIALSWCDQNPSGQEMGWHPFFISLRVVNWLKYLVRNAERAEELGYQQEIQQILRSVRIQVLSLEHRLERELLANHLLKNAKALIFAGALLQAPESRRWRELGQHLLLQQLREQVLGDGGHVERSPMYHAWVLDHLLDLQNLFASCPPEVPDCAEQVSRSIQRMGAYLEQIIHPDGEIPLLNDSQLGVTRPACEILQDAAPSRESECSGVDVRVLPESGYAVIRDRETASFLIFDCGRIGPDYQPGHGHADVLSFELTLHGKRVIVDTGVSSYEPGSERHYERSTAAHNTIRIDGVEQAEIWGTFRVGRRPSVSEINMQNSAGSQLLQGAHRGYKHLGLIHSRAIVRLATAAWVIVDRISGRGHHKVESFLHLHPDVKMGSMLEARLQGQGALQACCSIEAGAERYLLMAAGPFVARQTQAWYSPGFAVRHSQSVIHWAWDGEVPVTMLYAIVPEGAPSISISGVSPAGPIVIDGTLVPL